MNVLDAIVTRRNIKQFKPEPVDQEKVMQWLEAASYAPVHKMTEPWEIVFVGPETRAKLNHKNNYGGAPTLIMILSKPAKTEFDREEHIEAVSCFIQNFLLAAHAEGVGTGWATIGHRPEFREILGVAEGYDMIGLLPVGYPLEVPAVRPRTPIADKIAHLP